jgi:hypothetical protein
MAAAANAAEAWKSRSAPGRPGVSVKNTVRGVTLSSSGFRTCLWSASVSPTYAAPCSWVQKAIDDAISLCAVGLDDQGHQVHAEISLANQRREQSYLILMYVRPPLQSHPRCACRAQSCIFLQASSRTHLSNKRPRLQMTPEHEVQGMLESLNSPFPVGLAIKLACFQHLLPINHRPCNLCNCPAHWEHQLQMICSSTQLMSLLEPVVMTQTSNV